MNEWNFVHKHRTSRAAKGKYLIVIQIRSTDHELLYTFITSHVHDDDDAYLEFHTKRIYLKLLLIVIFSEFPVPIDSSHLKNPNE